MFNYYNTQVTVELGELIESGVKLWDFEYPVPRSVIEYNGKTCKVDFDKATFEQKVIDHYRFRQIGQETPGRFLHYFRARMREIMPYYVQLYEFDAKFRNIDDPLESYNLVETFQQATRGTGRSTSAQETLTSTENAGLTEFADTPQGVIDNMDTHLTNATRVTNSDSVQSNGTIDGTTEDTGETTHTLTRKGNIGVQPLGGEVENIRNAFINIDMQIINELKDLFLQVY